MPNFSVPATFQKSAIENFAAMNKKWEFPVKEVYGSLNPSIFGSGRHGAVLHPITLPTLQDFIKVCQNNQIEFNYTMNFNCAANMEYTPDGKKKILNFIKKLNDIGVKRFTAVLPSVIELINEAAPEAKVSVSVISEVDSLSRLKAFLSFKNVDKIMLPEFMNRKIKNLDKLLSYKKELNCGFGTIVNSTCLIDCPFRSFHYAFASHSQNGKVYQPIDYWSASCTAIKLKNPTEVLRMGWIRPEDIRKYANMGIDTFKIGGREMKNVDFSRIVNIYNEGSYDGNLWTLLRCFSDPPSELMYSQMFELNNKDLGDFTQKFFDVKNLCSTKDCDTCNYCNSHSNLVKANNGEKWASKLQDERKSFTQIPKRDLKKTAHTLLRV